MRKMKILHIVKYMIYIIFLVPTVSVFSLDLGGTSWGPERGGFGIYLSFQEDGRFSWEVYGMGDDFLGFGTYTQTENDVALTFEMVCKNELKDVYNDKVIILSIVETSESLFSIYQLVDESEEYFPVYYLNVGPNIGEKRMINGHMIFVYRAFGIILENARIREGPGTQYSFFTVYEDIPLSSIPKGEQVRIYGYSEVKTVIDGVENCWYYCRYGFELYGWVWGGLINFEE